MLQELQNRAARILTSSPYAAESDAGYLLQQLNWRDLTTRHQIQVALIEMGFY